MGRAIQVYTSQTRELIRRNGETARMRPCPNCGRPMHLSPGSDQPRTIFPDLRRYRCGECGVSVTDTADD
jgi:ribosomal protein S27AE